MCMYIHVCVCVCVCLCVCVCVCVCVCMHQLVHLAEVGHFLPRSRFHAFEHVYGHC